MAQVLSIGKKTKVILVNERFIALLLDAMGNDFIWKKVKISGERKTVEARILQKMLSGRVRAGVNGGKHERMQPVTVRFPR